MPSFIANITHGLNMVGFDAIIHALILILVGLILAKIVSAAFIRVLRKYIPSTRLILIRRILFYTTLSLFVIAALQHLGFKLNVLLGAAGVLTVALGFASQTSVSNIISGLFLIAEKSFIIGDSIKLDSISGEILSIDLLSVKIRTNDNTLVRIPNEVLIKTSVTNLTRFPIRRFDLPLGIAYKEDLETVRKILLELADKNPLCLEEPKPMVYILGFGDSAINLQFSVWAARQNFTALKNTIQEEIKSAFASHNIEMPFPQLSLSVASVTDPFPVRVLN